MVVNEVLAINRAKRNTVAIVCKRFYPKKRVQNNLDTFPVRHSICLSFRLPITQSVSQSLELCHERYKYIKS